MNDDSSLMRPPTYLSWGGHDSADIYEVFRRDGTDQDWDVLGEYEDDEGGRENNVE